MATQKYLRFNSDDDNDNNYGDGDDDDDKPLFKDSSSLQY